MRHLREGGLLVMVLGLAMLLPGCNGEDNDKAAKIEGPPSSDSGTVTDRRARAGGAGNSKDLKTQGYPGEGSAPSNAGGGGRRKN